MKNITQIFIAAITYAALTLPIQAAVTVSVTDADLDPDAGQFGVASVGTLSKDQNIVDGPGPQDLIYTVSGLTIDQDGTANDSVTITFTGTAVGNINSGYNNASQGFFVSPGSWLSVGQWTQLDFTSMSVDLSSGAQGVGNFEGFTNLQVQNGEPGDSYEVNGVLYSDPAGSQDIAIANENFIRLEGISVSGIGNTGGTYRMFDWNFQFSATVAPEPSTLGLLLVGSALLSRTRKKLKA